MTFRVVILPKAMRQLYDSAIWWAEHRSTEQACNWLAGFEASLQSLEKNPANYSLAPEDNEFPQLTIRQMTYGLGRNKTHRALFEVRDNDVLILAIRHLARQDLTQEDLDA